METALVLLAKSTVQCSKAIILDFHSFNVWINVLGPWLQKVINLGKSNRLNSVDLTFSFFCY